MIVRRKRLINSICPAIINICPIDVHLIITGHDIMIFHLVVRNLETEKDGHGLIIKWDISWHAGTRGTGKFITIVYTVWIIQYSIIPLLKMYTPLPFLDINKYNWCNFIWTLFPWIRCCGDISILLQNFCNRSRPQRSIDTSKMGKRKTKTNIWKWKLLIIRESLFQRFCVNLLSSYVYANYF